MSDLSPEAPPAETTEERLRRLEFAIASMHPGLAPEGYAPPMPAQGGVIPLSLLVNAAVEPEAVRRRLLRDLPLLREIQLIVRMYLDPRYRLSRLAQLGVPLLVALAVFNYTAFNLMFPIIPFLTPIAERLILLVLGAGLAAVLTREAIRYGAVLDYLARAGR